MTARKGLKKIVRERMSRTGETYSTALRHVTGGPVRPDAAGTHHDSLLVQHLLAEAGWPLSEAMVCGLGGGIGFMYAIFEYDVVPHPLLTIVAQHHPQPWAPAVLDRLPVRYEQQHSSSTKAALGKLDAVLVAGRSALCTVDRGGLPWHPAGRFEGAEPYGVLVSTGAASTVTVLDPPHGTHQLAIEEFGAAWSRHRQGRHQLLAVSGPAEPAEELLDAAISDALATTVAHLTGPVLGNSFDVNFGFSGMAKLASELRDDRGRRGWARRFASTAGYAHAMRRLADCLEFEYTAPGATRPLYADFLDEAAPELAAAADLIRDSGRTWSELARRAADAGPNPSRAADPDGGSPPDPAEFRAWCDEAADLVDRSLVAERAAADAIAGRG